VQIVHSGQHVGAVGALLTPCLDQAARLEALKHPVEQQVLCPTCDEAGAELGKHAEVEPWVGQLETERILPVDPGANRISRLPIAEMLKELEHRDQGQPPRCKAGLAACGVERAEVLVFVEDAELVAQPHHNCALGKCRVGNTHCLGRDRTNRLRVKAHG
jgi:hypothetical protein